MPTATTIVGRISLIETNQLVEQLNNLCDPPSRQKLRGLLGRSEEASGHHQQNNVHDRAFHHMLLRILFYEGWLYLLP